VEEVAEADLGASEAVVLVAGADLAAVVPAEVGDKAD
jgi:hypothetical protein